MERLKEILTKKYYIREMVLLIFIILSLFFLSIYSSLAIFEKTVEKTGAVAFEASPISLSISSDEQSYQISGDGTYGTITVGAGETKAFDITITNETPIGVKYKTWYRFTSGVTILDVEVGISNISKNENTSTLTKDETDGNQKKVRVIIKNNSNQSATIDIGVSGGYSANEVALQTGYSEMLTIEEGASFVDTSGANEPILGGGMIPVVYDETCNDNDGCWVRADTESGWYAYQDQIWANAVTTTSENRETYLSDEHIGQEIPMSEINSMWVWIPRYRYKIETGIGSSAALTNPPEIDVVFESGTETNGVTEAQYRTGIASDGTNSNYYTHPAFRNVANITYDSSTSSRGAWDEEITGFWVAKFEAGTTPSTSNNTNICNASPAVNTCVDVNPVIKPGAIALRYQTVNTQFKHALKLANGEMPSSTVSFSMNQYNLYGLNKSKITTDTHMMKNTEWGAVAILSQSQYGKMGNDNYSGLNKEIYINNSSLYYTGRSLGNVPQSTASNIDAGTYSYDDKSCATTTANLYDIGQTCTGEKTPYAGTGASTTGTIYGIYDMNGGAWEYVMGNWANNKGEAGLSYMPPSKYYDLYNGTSTHIITKENAIMGDATWETLSWYSDSAASFYPSSTYKYTWYNRGESYGGTTSAGIFTVGTNTGNANANITWRPVLMAYN